MSKNEKELAVKPEQAVAAFDPSLVDDTFADMELDSADIIIPKVLLMQPSSQLVGDEKATIGDFVHSLTNVKLGSIVDPIEIIPFYSKKSWDILNSDDNNAWIRNEAFTPENANLPWVDKEGATNIKRVKRLDFYCMVPKLLAEGSVLPCVVSFKSTGYRSGGLIITQWHEIKAKNATAKQQGNLNLIKLPFSKSFVLAGKKLQNEKKQTYCVPSIEIGRDVDAETQKLCLQWLQTVKTAKNIIVDESDNSDTGTAGDHVDVADGTGAF